VFDIATRFKPVIVTVGERGKGQAIESNAFGHATAGGNAGDEGDTRPHANEELGELQAWIDMALGRICYEEEVGADHNDLAKWDCFTQRDMQADLYIKDGDRGYDVCSDDLEKRQIICCPTKGQILLFFFFLSFFFFFFFFNIDILKDLQS
jgi:hypothetical protein